jgi:phenylalanyl-tRNA synthetase alpha chain
MIKKIIKIKKTINKIKIKNYSQIPNITKNIEEKLNKKIYLKNDHPLNTLKNKVEEYFKNKIDKEIKIYDNLNPRVTTKQCFDDLLIEKEHSSRNPTNTYFFNHDECLRTHTTAHQTQFLSLGDKHFIITGDVYRRDEVGIIYFSNKKKKR